jgi:hypothetical protein
MPVSRCSSSEAPRGRSQLLRSIQATPIKSLLKSIDIGLEADAEYRPSTVSQ